MQVVTGMGRMQRLAQGWQRRGIAVGFVPTMGYLHEGHLSLMRRAREEIGPKGKVVVSIYVNPTQFGPQEDFHKYPRDLRRDQGLCAEAGVDVIFAPSDREMYPRGFSTYVVEEALSRVMEGRSRPAHFRGVTTVVAKLFHLVQPTVAVFGAKDYQQAAIIRRMTRDLNFPVKIIVAPTAREADGLAMSSRNQYLAGDLRTQATALWQAILMAQVKVRGARGPIGAEKLREQVRALVERQPAARVDYIEFFDPATLEPLGKVGRGTQMALAVVVGTTRLIDNALL